MGSEETVAPDRGRLAFIVGGVVVVFVVIGVIVSVLRFQSAQEKTQEGTTLGQPEVTDGIKATATISSVDPLKGEMVVKLAMDPEGSYNDNGLLAKPVTLYSSSPGGTKQTDFKAGKPLGSTDLVLPLIGDVNSYPWDKYDTELELQFVSASEAAPSASPSTTTTTTTAPPAEGAESGGEAKPAETKPAATKSNLDTLVPVSLFIYKQLPSYNVVEITPTEQNDEGVLQAGFEVKRATAAVGFSVLVSIIMWGLALGVMFIALSIIFKRRKLELAAISLMGVILFAMPAALRSFQPGVPPPGTLSDFYSFFWCDVIVAVSLISVLITYLKRRPD